MKKRVIILTSIFYALLLGVINFIAIAIGHSFMPVALPYLIYPFLFFIMVMKWLGILKDIPYYIELLLIIPLYWPIMITIILYIKNKMTKYIILISSYILSFVLILENIFNDPTNTIASWPFFICLEAFGLFIFVLGQIGIFYVLKLKNQGRLK